MKKLMHHARHAPCNSYRLMQNAEMGELLTACFCTSLDLHIVSLGVIYLIVLLKSITLSSAIQLLCDQPLQAQGRLC